MNRPLVFDTFVGSLATHCAVGFTSDLGDCPDRFDLQHPQIVSAAEAWGRLRELTSSEGDYPVVWDVLGGELESRFAAGVRAGWLVWAGDRWMEIAA